MAACSTSVLRCDLGTFQAAAHVSHCPPRADGTCSVWPVAWPVSPGQPGWRTTPARRAAARRGPLWPPVTQPHPCPHRCADGRWQSRQGRRLHGPTMVAGDDRMLGDGPYFRTGGTFGEERIGAEHGEGFTTIRPSGQALRVDVDFLNEKMRKRGRQRMRFQVRPDEAFGLVYSWEGVLADTRPSHTETWRRLAEEEGRPVPDYSRPVHSIPPERVITQVLGWTREPEEVARLVVRASELYCQEVAKLRAPQAGLREWLQALRTAGVPCAVTSALSRATVVAMLDAWGLRHFFQAVVTNEDGMEAISQRFLSAALKLDRAPNSCVVFEDDPRGIAAAHNCTMKAVALVGTHPAYELEQADLTVSNFSELSVINLRRLFANQGAEFMDPLKQPRNQSPPRRRNRNDMIPP
ncbi:Haloacid dehalogenase-like hydrolase (HAD) superfamily protein [Klebsormidium nitens]|uniref:Haloacid dehalogenase-like hydrolase (HAD) superfamily protein n=1 Tax=Klebsormidium nitens TaxID=105231 RepID=A0A1Y1IK59_KLENI|nr:Haloacid dehalogenase-like hydrolase (HAD) superfamily protein [Klebsormidium nitens]|eukprot:GAQ91255.1 Haloacid dehalogenase-like hydrolase (HAD) superfamily protein [Klebsormidium nitens]